MLSIVPVVEGPGDVAAFPLLLRRILQKRYQRFDIGVAKPRNGNGRSNLIKRFEDFLNYAAIVSGCGAILVLLDSDDDCPREQAASLAARCNQASVNKPVAIVCATREYEAWFLASLETIKGNAGIPESVSFSGNIETLRGVKEWLGQQMPPAQRYKEDLHQTSLTQHIDLELAHANSRSFRRLCHAVEQLVEAIDQGTVVATP